MRPLSTRLLSHEPARLALYARQQAIQERRPVSRSSRRPSTRPTRDFNAVSFSCHPSSDPDHEATDMGTLHQRGENQISTPSATVVLGGGGLRDAPCRGGCSAWEPCSTVRLDGGSWPCATAACTFAPLSKGTGIEDNIRCPYHGLLFDASGRSVANPLEKRAPRSARIQNFPVVKRDDIVWFWPAIQRPPILASCPTFLPHRSTLQARLQHDPGRRPSRARDGQPDGLSHTNMLHPPLVGVIGSTSELRATRDGDIIQADWISTARGTWPAWNTSFPDRRQADRTVAVDAVRPAGSMYLQVAVTGRANRGRSATPCRASISSRPRRTAQRSTSGRLQFAQRTGSRWIVPSRLHPGLRAGE